LQILKLWNFSLSVTFLLKLATEVAGKTARTPFYLIYVRTALALPAVTDGAIAAIVLV
jgi:predicted membrane chloride channel (bestrophin family)